MKKKIQKTILKESLEINNQLDKIVINYKN